MMKKLFLVSAVIAAGLLAACANPTVGTDPDPDPITPEGYATVVIPLPQAGIAPMGASLPSAMAYTDFFEVFFRTFCDDQNDYVYFATSAPLSDGQLSIQIPVGVYDILLLAGWDPHGWGGTHYLLASSYILNQSINPGINTINMTLNNISVNISAPETVEAAESFPVSVTVDTRNPLLAELLNYSGSGTEFPSLFNISFNDVLRSPQFTQIGNILTFDQVTFTAPLSPSPGIVGAGL